MGRRDTDSGNWGGHRFNSGRPLKPLTPIAAKEKAAELVRRAIKVLDSAEVGGYGAQLMSIVDSLEEDIRSERATNLRNIIEASDNNAVMAEYNGMYTVVDGSALNGTFTVTTGTQELPPIEYQEVVGIDAAIDIIKSKDLLNEDWQPVEEE